MKPLLVSQSDSVGGAARATMRLHQALSDYGTESRVQVGVKTTDIYTVDGPASKFNKLAFRVRPHLGKFIMRLQDSHDSSPRSLNYLNSGLLKTLSSPEFDLLNIHWINNEFLSIEDIGRLHKPIVLTLHDMWAFCGTEHYAAENDNARWRIGYNSGNRPSQHSGIDLDMWAWTRKHKFWKKPMQIITPSNWLAECVKSSKLMHDWPVDVIPNPIDTQTYQKWPKKFAREILGLPQDAPLVMFGAIGGGKDLRKGWDLLEGALQGIDKKQGIECVVFGQSEPREPPKFGLNIHWMGHVNDDVTLALLYSAADVMLVPSRQENLPQSATEAQACGCPVVAFNCTGMPEVVLHEDTGYLARAFDIEDFANGIMWILSDMIRYQELSDSAVKRAARLWSSEVVAAKYIDAYSATIKAHSSR